MPEKAYAEVEFCASWVAVAYPPMGVQLCVESWSALSQMSAVRLRVTPEKVVVWSLTSRATPASCSGVEMSYCVCVPLYQEMSEEPSQTVWAWVLCANAGSVTARTRAIRRKRFFIVKIPDETRRQKYIFLSNNP